MQTQMIDEETAIVNFEYEDELEARELRAFLRLKEAAAGFRGLEARLDGNDAVNHHRSFPKSMPCSP